MRILDGGLADIWREGIFKLFSSLCFEMCYEPLRFIPLQ